MSSINPKRLVENHRLDDTYMNMRAQTCKFYIGNFNEVGLDEEQLDEVTMFVNENLNTDLSTEQIDSILWIYPKLRIKLSVYNTHLLDTELEGMVLDMLADFFLGCTWPIYGDKLDQDEIDEFKILIKSQIEKTFSNDIDKIVI